MKKRLLASLLCGAMTVSLLPMTAFAEEQLVVQDVQVQADTQEAEKSGTCGENVTWTLDDEGTLTISGTGEMEAYGDEEEAPWAPDKSRIRRIIIENAVTSVGEYAFYGCDDLTDVTISDSVQKIGNGAFYECDSLKAVTIPGSVTEIGRDAFSDCYQLTTVELSDGLLRIGEGAFRYCNIAEIEIPNSVTSIEKEAFSECKFTNVRLPDQLTNLAGTAFSACENLKEITVGENNTVFSSNDGVLYNKEQTKIVCCPQAKAGAYVIPKTVTEIGESAFNGCGKITSIEIPDGVITIGAYAFNLCNGLKSVIIPDSVTSIGEYGFNGCNISTLRIGNGVKSIGMRGFAGCPLKNVKLNNRLKKIEAYTFMGAKLTSFRVPDSVTQIEPYAFSECSTLKSLTIGKKVKKIEWYAFGACKNLKDVYYLGTKKQWKSIEIENNAPLTNAKMHYNAEGATSVSKVKKLAVANTQSKKLKVTWTKNIMVDGYQLQYSTNKSFSKATSRLIKSYQTTSTTLSKLKKNKKYYVRMRCYVTQNGKKTYSKWTTSGRVTIKK